MKLHLVRIWPKTLRFDFMSFRKVSYTLSVLLSIATIILVLTRGLNFGIDFTGGITMDIESDKTISAQSIRTTAVELGCKDVTVQSYSDNALNLRIGASEDSKVIVDKIKDSINKSFPDHKFVYKKVDFVGPAVGRQLIQAGAQSLFLAFVVIMIYIWIRFEWQFGIGAIVALVHDAILVIGFMSLTQLDFNMSSIAAILTVIGYSINDSVVIYDRIRENMRKYKQKSMPDIINLSVNETLSRTTLTVLTTLIANLAIILFGGEALQSFSIMVFFGITVGTYSSIFVSAPILTLFRLNKLTEKTISVDA